MRTVTAREIIRKEYGSSRNFMTPHKVRCGKISRRVAFELSSGSGLFDRSSTIYGVSFAEITESGETIRRTDISGVFDSREDAEAYIEELKGGGSSLPSSPILEIEGETEATARV